MELKKQQLKPGTDALTPRHMSSVTTHRKRFMPTCPTGKCSPLYSQQEEENFSPSTDHGQIQKTRGISFYKEKGYVEVAVIIKESIGKRWEFKVYRFLIGWVITVSD